MKNLVLGIGIFFGIFSCTKKIDYSTQVKPILNKHCLSCHGGVKKQGGFSLLFQEEALAKAESGLYPIIPGNASKSELIKRISHHDTELRMPYEKDPLSKEEIQILTKWINQGAEWSDHWAYVPLKKPASLKGIDFYIQKTAQNNGLELMPLADDITLRRRIALDLIGMPTLFSSSLPLSEYIDSLLKLPEFGEKWTSMWLDLARYADTKGYERDDSRDIWRYRDWVIEAFNQDMPYDSFLILQIAGDLIPNPSDQDYLATAFHRNTMTNDEGGTENEEYRVAAVIDRVNTTWEVMMGTTFSCVQCHSHPFDPFKHEDYYKFLAYFNNTRDEDTYHDYPVLRHFSDTAYQKLQHFQKNLDTWTPEQSKSTIHFIKTLQPSINSIQSHSFVNAELSDTKFLGMRNKSSAILPNVDLSDKNVLVFQARARVKNGRLIIKAGEIIADVSINVKPEEFWQWKNFRVPIQNISGVHDLELSYFSAEIKDPNTEGVYFNWFHFTKDWEVKDREHRVALYNQFLDLLNEKTPATPIFLENTGQQVRKTHVFERGAWTSHLEEVKPGIPEIFLKNNNIETEGNRLDLAKWMTSKENPLVARTMVNRIWEQLFGIGLVETLEDLGSQGIPSPHIALLDELSYRFMTEMNWSIKTLIKEIMISATYRQDSRVTDQHLKIDPDNKLFARGPRVRLTGEQIRDQALLISGLLSKKMFGPPVMPYQPEGIWNAPYNGAKWKLSEGEDRYRRAVYTFWKRTSPYPALTNFDGAQREVCVSRRIRTNTPLQALVTMNDSAYVEMSYHFAKMALEKENSIEYAYQRATGKKPDEKKLKILGELYLEVLEEFECDPTLEPELEAMAIVCNTIFNLDEVLNKT